MCNFLKKYLLFNIKTSYHLGKALRAWYNGHIFRVNFRYNLDLFRYITCVNVRYNLDLFRYITWVFSDI